MTLNELVQYAKEHNFDFDAQIIFNDGYDCDRFEVGSAKMTTVRMGDIGVSEELSKAVGFEEACKLKIDVIQLSI